MIVTKLNLDASSICIFERFKSTGSYTLYTGKPETCVLSSIEDLGSALFAKKNNFQG